MSLKNLETYLAIAIGLFCLLKGNTACLALVVFVEIISSRITIKAKK